MNNQYYQEYLRLIAEEQARQQQNNDPFANAKNAAAKIGSYGDKLSTVGNAINNYVSNPTVQTIGSRMSALGGNLTNGANTVTNALNTPQNYFKGVANRTIGTGLQNAGNYLAQKTGIANTLGIGMQKLGASMAGNAAATGAAASGGAAAGGAAFSNPVTALVALGAMAAMGANRKRAKKGGQALLNSTNQEVSEGADNALAQTQQNAANLQAASQQAFNNGIVTGGAASPQQLTPIQEYQEYLRGQGYSDDIINGVPQGLNGGNKDIAEWINQYNAGTGKDNPINIPQTAEEIAAAKAGSFNNMQTGNATENVKQGILDKFINGISDLSKGYQENKENGFKPENLARDNSKSKMTRIGEAAGTISRAAQKPAVQALLAGGLSTALTGNPLYGLGQAYKFGNARTNTNIYQEVLKNQGINVDTGMLGSLGSSDFNALMTPQYKEAMNNIALAKLQEAQNYHDMLIQNQITKNKIAQQNANTNEYKAKNGTTVKHIGGSESGNKTKKPTDHPDWNQDLADFTSIMSNPRYAARMDEAKARFIKKHGVDPMKYIKY